MKPILTLAYFESEACRREAAAFLDAERAKGRDDLVLPIYMLPIYMKTAEILDHAALRRKDPLAVWLHARQRQDRRDAAARLMETPGIAMRIVDLARQIAVADSRDRTADLPLIPEQGAGIRVQVNEDGLIDRAPEEHDARLEALTAALQEACSRLLGSFEDGLGQNAFGYLLNDVRACEDAIGKPLAEIQFTDVWRLGLGLQNIADAAAREVGRLAPSQKDDQQAALKNLVGLHGPFILSSKEGMALHALSRENNATRAEQAAFEDSAREFVEAVRESTDLATDQVKDLLAQVNQVTSEGRHPERQMVTAETTNRNFLVAVSQTVAVFVCAAGIIENIAAGSALGNDLVGLRVNAVNRLGQASGQFLVIYQVLLKGLAAVSSEGLGWLSYLIHWTRTRLNGDADGKPPWAGGLAKPPASKPYPLTLPAGTVLRDA